MNKKIDNAYLNQYTDNVINRGYEIYDEWVSKKHNSRKIVSAAVDAAKLFKKRKNMVAFFNALSHLFALDMRIKERYNNIFRCIFSYFSWRRETRALGFLKRELNIQLGEADIRNLIAVEIERLAEKLEDEWYEDGDDEAHGGKRNVKAEEEVASEEKEAETAEENSEVEELDDKEKAEKDAEEKEEKPIEDTQIEEANEEIGEKNETAEPQQEEVEITVTDKEKAPTQKNVENLKEENNVSDVESESSIDQKDKTAEVRSYNDAVDSPPLYDETIDDRASKKISLIDEMIIDSMLRGDKDIMGYQRIDDAGQSNQVDTARDSVASKGEENKGADKDAYLYDKMLATVKGEAQRTVVESTKQPEKASEIKTEQPKDTVNSNEQAFKPISEMLQTNNSNVDLENNIANEINTNMSLESKMSLIRMQEDQLREHMSITLEELGMDDTSDVLRVSEPNEVSPPSVAQNRK